MRPLIIALFVKPKCQLEAGGKPSTWFPPGQLEELSLFAKVSDFSIFDAVLRWIDLKLHFSGKYVFEDFY